MVLNFETSVGDIVAEDFKYAAVFEKFNIDFCCSGQDSIGVACQKHSVDLQTLMDGLLTVETVKTQDSPDFNSWPLDLLVDYIVKKHHAYVDQRVPLINSYLEKLCSVHGGRHPELFEVASLFKESGGALVVHMKKEEFILFPFIRKMIAVRKDNQPLDLPRFGNVENPISAMHQDHNDEGERFRRINELSNGYTPPEDACNTYRVAYEELKEFERDLHLHIHLENNILFPKAIELQNELAKDNQ